MTGRWKQLALLMTVSVLLAGCATSQAATQTRPKTLSPGAGMTPGMIMPDGSTMGGAASSTPKAAQEKPSASAAMVCAAETRTSIKTVLAIKQVPAGTATYADHLYTCTYKLPMGLLILSVKESPDRASTDTYYTALRQAFSNTRNVDGLGEAAWGTQDGTVVLRKDNDVLRVDATGLPTVFGSQHAKRNDFAYEIASDILGCWTGDE